MFRHLATLSSVLLLLGAALAPTASAQQTIQTRSGNTLEGTLNSDDGKAISFTTSDGIEMTLPYGDLDGQTVYRLLAGRTAKTDAAGQVRLGDAAASVGMFDAARDAYSLASKADPSLRPQLDAKLASLRAAASAALLASAQRESKGGESQAAMQSLTTLMHEFPDEPAAKSGSALLETLHSGQAASRSKAQAQLQSQEVQETMAPAEANYAEMGRKIKDGLQNTRNQGTAIDDFRAAVDIGTSTREVLKELEAQSGSMPGLTAAVQQLDADILAQIINGYVQLANVYNQRSSYNDANTAVNAGLALEPKNQQLLQLREQIASNAAEEGGFVGWGGAVRVAR